jgi:LysM repeat protein
MAKSAYDFYLGKCLLPITPEKLQIKIKNENKTITLINQGQINILKTAGLTDIEFECCIPQVQYPFAVYTEGFKESSYFLEYFESLKVEKTPFQFIVSRTLPNGEVLFSTDMKVSLEEYTLTEEAKKGFDVVVKIKLKQYREYGTKIISLLTDSSDESSSTATVQETRASETSPEPSSPEKYTVVKGDCLWNIAKKYYNDGSKYTVIYNANKDIVGANPNLIYPGQVLTIPTL